MDRRMSWWSVGLCLMLQVNLSGDVLVPGRAARGHLAAGSSRNYQFYGRAGQSADVQLTGTADLYVEVTSAGHIPSPLPGAARRDRAHRWHGALPRSGPYRVVVQSKGPADFQLRLRLR